jgi:hypothetical protein
MNVIIYNDWLLGCSLPTPLPLGVSPFYYGIINDMCSPTIEKFGATPANIQWTVVRGDSASFTVSLLENDEVTEFDTTGWTYSATAYDPLADVLDELTVTVDGSVVTVTAPADITANWGTKYKSVVAELSFDLQAVVPDGPSSMTWTPVIGTICVLGNVSPVPTRTTGGIS